DSNVIYITTGGGGAWKSKDGGKTWQPLFDRTGSVITQEEQTVTATGGSFTLTFNGQTTTPLTAGSTAAQVKTALDALSTIGGAGGFVTVVQNGNVYSVAFGGDLRGQDQPLMSGVGATVTAFASGYGITREVQQIS